MLILFERKICIKITFNDLIMKALNSISLTIHPGTYSVPEKSKIIIKRNLIGNKWILKINEKKKEPISNFQRKLFVYLTLSLLFVLFISVGLIIVFRGELHLHTRIIKPLITSWKPPVSNNVNKLEKFVKIDLVESRNLSDEIQGNLRETKPIGLGFVNNKCENCSNEEICIFMSNQRNAECKKIVDGSDPTGCAGICRIDTEFCRKISKNLSIYQCMEYPMLQIECPVADKKFNCGELCLPETKKCDGIIHCLDKSDEMSCECNKTTHFRCGENTSCLPNSYKCNGIVDCWDANDELHCNKDCPEKDDFPCLNSNKCIKINKFCDGIIDCIDGSDEPDGCR